MPELPEVETVRRGLAPVMEGARVSRVEARRPDLRWPLQRDFVARIEGKTVEGLGRRGKFLLADLSSGDVLIMHLGMSGSFRVDASPRPACGERSTEAKRGRVRGTLDEPSTLDSPSPHPSPRRRGERDHAPCAPQDPNAIPSPSPGVFHYERSRNSGHDHVVFHMSSGATITFNDPRRFGFMKLVRRVDLEREPLVRALGPEPLGNAFDATELAAACVGKKTSLKAALSDQRVVAGLGNIYVCEALHRARLSPKRRASTIATKSGVPNERAERLVEAIKAVLGDAIRQGGSSLRDHRQTNGDLGYFQHHFRVYDREGDPCPTHRCKGTIKRIVQTGRSTFFCPVCQK